MHIGLSSLYYEVVHLLLSLFLWGLTTTTIVVHLWLNIAETKQSLEQGPTLLWGHRINSCNYTKQECGRFSSVPNKMQTTKKTNVHNEEVGAEDLPVWTIWNHAPSTIRWNFRLKTQTEFLFFFCPTEPNFFSLPIHVESVHEISTLLNAADCDCAVRMKTLLARGLVGRALAPDMCRRGLEPWLLRDTFISIVYLVLYPFSYTVFQSFERKRAGLGIEGYSL